MATKNTDQNQDNTEPTKQPAAAVVEEPKETFYVISTMLGARNPRTGKNFVKNEEVYRSDFTPEVFERLLSPDVAAIATEPEAPNTYEDKSL